MNAGGGWQLLVWEPGLIPVVFIAETGGDMSAFR
jgi:hypothetical protein